MLELQTAYVSSLGHLQTPGEDHIPSLMRRIRISRLKCCSLTSDNEKIDFSGYLMLPFQHKTSNGSYEHSFDATGSRPRQKVAH